MSLILRKNCQKIKVKQAVKDEKDAEDLLTALQICNI